MTESFIVTTVITPDQEIYLDALQKLAEKYNIIPLKKKNNMGIMFNFEFKDGQTKKEFWKELNKIIPVI